jgi:hypothetical protein
MLDDINELRTFVGVVAVRSPFRDCAEGTGRCRHAAGSAPLAAEQGTDVYERAQRTPLGLTG